MKDFRSVVNDYLKKHDRHKKQLAAVVSLSMLVSFTVPMVLQEPASGMTGDSFTPVGDILSTKLFNAANNSSATLSNKSESNGNIVNDVTYSPAQMSVKDLLIGSATNDSLDWANGATTAADVIKKAENKYFLGIAYDFCVFLENDFTPKEADSEGRVAVGGNIISLSPWGNYQIGAGDYGTNTPLKNTDNYTGISDFAHVIANGYISRVDVYGTKESGSQAVNYNDDFFKRLVIGNYEASEHWDDNKSGMFEYSCTHSHYLLNNDNNNWISNNPISDIDEKAQIYMQSSSSPLIDFTEIFESLRTRSDALQKKTSIPGVVDGDSVTFTVPANIKEGNTVYFSLPSWEGENGVQIQNVYFEFEDKENPPLERDGLILREKKDGQYVYDEPEGSWSPTCNIVVNVGGATGVSIGNSNNLTNTYVNGLPISNRPAGISEDWSGLTDKTDKVKATNNRLASEKILYNFYEAQDIKITGNFNGTIFAPNADVNSDDGCSGHLSGALIAKSFKGGLEFGYRPYRGTVDILGSSNGYAVPFDKFIKDTTSRLEGATFSVLEVKDGQEEEVDSFTIGNSTEYVNIPSKVDFESSAKDANFETVYKIREKSAPTGFIKDPDTYYTVTISEKVENGIFTDDEGNPNQGNTGAILTGRPSEVSATVTITDKDGKQVDRFNIYLKDIWGYDESSGNDAIIRREIYIGDKDNPTDTFYLDMKNGNVEAVSKKEGNSIGTGVVAQTGPRYTASITTSYETDIPKTIYATEVVTVQAVDEEGNLLFDEENNPVMTTYYEADSTTPATKYVIDADGSTQTTVATTVIEKAIGGGNLTEYEINIINFKGDVSGGYEVTFYHNDPSKNQTYSGNSKDNENNLDLGELDKKGVVGISLKFNDTVNNEFFIQQVSGWGVIFNTNYSSWKQFDAGEAYYYYDGDSNPANTTTRIETSYSTVTTSILTLDESYETETFDISTSYYDKYATILAEPTKAQTYGTKTTAVSGETPAYRFDPGAMMMMPLPASVPKFENDYGLIFQKVSKSGETQELLSGATIKLEKVTFNGNEPVGTLVTDMDNVLEGGSSNTIDLSKIDANKLYRFVETLTPANHEDADPIYFVYKSAEQKVYYTSDVAKAKDYEQSTDGWTPVNLRINNTDNPDAVTMIDIKKSGATFWLEKTNMDYTEKLEGSKFQLYVKEGQDLIPVYPVKKDDNNRYVIDGNFEIPEAGENLYELFKANSGKCNGEYIKDGYLVPGLYKLDEITPPADYDQYTEGFEFRVKNDYSIEPVAVGSVSYEPIGIKWENQNGQAFVTLDNSKLDGNSTSINNVVSYEVKLADSTQANVYLNTDTGLNKTFSDGVLIGTFSNPTNINKFEIQYSSWKQGGWDIEYVTITTEDGKTYKYTGDGSGGGSSVKSYKIGKIGLNKNPSISVSKVTFYYSDGSTDVLNNPTTDTDEWNGYIKLDGIKSTENVVGIKVEASGYNGLIFVQENDGSSYPTIFNTNYSSTHDFNSNSVATFGECNDTSSASLTAVEAAAKEAKLSTRVLKLADLKSKTKSAGTASASAQSLSLTPKNVSVLAGEEKSFGSVSITNDNHHWGTFKYGDGNHTVKHLYCITENETEIKTYYVDNEDGKVFNLNNGICDVEITNGKDSGEIQIQPNHWWGGFNIKYVKVTTTDGNVYVYDPDNTGGSSGGDQTTQSTAKPTTPTTTTTVAVNGLQAQTSTKTNGDVVLQLPNRQAGEDMSVEVEKKWSFLDSFPELKEEVTVKLERYTDAECTETNKDTSYNPDQITLNAGNEWKGKWENLPRSQGSTTYWYKVVEVTELTNFTTTYSTEDGVNTSSKITITNKPQTININAEKKWVKSDGTPSTDSVPESVEVQLQYKKNSNSDWENVENATYVLNSGNEWTTEITNLPAVYEYRIIETDVPAGWISTEGNAVNTNNGTSTVTNTQQTGSLGIEKIWENDNHGDRPGSITVNLYRSTQSPASGSSTITPQAYDNYSNYAKALQYSLYFYDANMCGDDVGETSAYSWRGDCHTYCDIDGGYHDAGDHTMFGLPQGFTASTLGWNYYEFKEAFDSLRQTTHYQTIMKRFCDFFAASYKDVQLLVQKGNGGTDHAYWGSPEQQSKNDFGQTEYWSSAEGSNIAADYAAALAQYVLNFPDDTENRDKYLTAAKALYEFAENTAPYSCSFYSDSESKSEKAWAAAWLYLATKDDSYKTKCLSNLDSSSYGLTEDKKRGFFWGDTMLGAATVYASHIDKNESKAKNIVTNYLSGDNGVIKPGSDKKYENAPYLITDDWGSARHNTLIQTVALSAAKNNIVDEKTAKNYTDWCEGQMRQILGDNDYNNNEGVCLVVGYNSDTSATSPHHRAASGLSGWEGEYGYNKWQDTVNSYSQIPNSHVILGALTNGPSTSSFSSYKDKIGDGTDNEVTLDYNAGLVGAAAGLYQLTGKGETDSAEQLIAASKDNEFTPHPETPINVAKSKDVKTNETQIQFSIGDNNKLVLKDTNDNEISGAVWAVASDTDDIIDLENGVIKAKKDGNASITATADGTSYTFPVKVALTSINEQDYIQKIKDYEPVETYTILNDNGNDNTWDFNIPDNLPLYNADGQQYYYYIVESDIDSTTSYYPISYSDGITLVGNTSGGKLSVTNKKPDSTGVTLPEAGGKGTRNFYLAGACLIGMAGMFWLIRRRKITK